MFATRNRLMVLALAGLLGAAGPSNAAQGTSPAASATPGLVYVTNNGSNNISGYTQDPNSGTLNATAAVFSGHAPSQVTVVATSSNGQTNNFVYATNSADGTVSGFSVNLLNGSLTALPGTNTNPFPVATGSNPNGIAQAGGGKFLYVANAGSNAISEFNIDASAGTLTPIGSGSVSTGNGPAAMTVVTVGPLSFLYVIDTADKMVEAFSISPTTGALTSLSSSSVGAGPAGIVANAAGTFLYVSNSSDGTITEFSIAAGGALTTEGTLTGLSTPQGLAMDSATHLYAAEAGNNNIAELQIANQTTGTLQINGEAAAGVAPSEIVFSSSHVYSTNMSDNTVSQFAASAQSGLLTPLSPAAVGAGAGPEGIAVNPTNLYVYVADSGETTLTPYSIGVNGNLTPVDLAKAGGGVTGITIDPTVHFVYASNNVDNSITEYFIDPSSGAPIPFGTAPEASGSGPQAIAANPTQGFIYVVNNTANNVESFKINGDGSLASASLAGTGTGPNAIAIDLSGSFAYVTNTQGNISEFSLGADGTISSIGTAASGNGPVGIAIAPSGGFAYVLNSVDKTVQELTRGQNGALTPTSNTVATGTSPAAVAITPSGQFLYVTNNGDNTVTGYTVNADGTLTAISGGTIGTGHGPKNLVIDPTGRFVYVVNNSTDKTISEFSINGDGTLASLGTAGTGALPLGIAISGSSTPPPPPVTSSVRVMPSKLRFPRIRVGRTSGAKAVVVKNTAKKGGSPVTFVGISTSRTEFQIKSTTCMGMLPANKACKIKVTFTPSDIGPVTGSLIIDDNAQNGSQTVPLSGTGTQPKK